MAKLLVVDDSPDAADMLVLFLKYAGHDAVAAGSGADGLDALMAEQFQIVISDIGMPYMDGYQFARAMRRVPGYAEVPLVAMSGYDLEADHKEVQRAGFNAHLEKPVDADVLIGLVDELTRNRGSERDMEERKSLSRSVSGFR
jgi:CheY-like chemotaxis protein